MIQKIIIDYKKLSNGAFATKVQTIINSLRGNESFANPVPTLEELTAALENFMNAVVAAGNGSKPAIVIRDQSRIALADLVRQLGLFVMFIANGDATILAGSGYDLAKARSSQNLETPGLVKMKDGISSGMLTVSIPKPVGGKGYIHELTADPLTADSVWLSVASSNVKHTFENLTPGKKYWSRVAAIGKGSEIAYSNVFLSRFVQ